MGKITDIQKQKRNKTRVSVYIDGEFVCGLDEITAASARIKIGDEISADELKAVVCRSEINSAFERAVNYVSYAPRARREVERYLSEKVTTKIRYPPRSPNSTSTDTSMTARMRAAT